jgi:hypothetical protein
MTVVIHPKDEGLPSLPRCEIAVGQVWEYAGYLGWSDRHGAEFRSSPPNARMRHTLNRHGEPLRIRIVQVPGGRAKQIKYVKIDPIRGGNGRPDRGENPISERALRKAYVPVVETEALLASDLTGRELEVTQRQTTVALTHHEGARPRRLAADPRAKTDTTHVQKQECTDV